LFGFPGFVENNHYHFYFLFGFPGFLFGFSICPITLKRQTWGKNPIFEKKIYYSTVLVNLGLVN
jgi:hypothetical protein